MRRSPDKLFHVFMKGYTVSLSVLNFSHKSKLSIGLFRVQNQSAMNESSSQSLVYGFDPEVKKSPLEAWHVNIANDESTRSTE